MNRRYLSVAVALVGAALVWTAWAGSEGGGARPGPGARPGISAEERGRLRQRFQNMSEEERAKFREQMRARFQNMSEEERRQLRERMGSRFGGRSRLSKEEQLKAIAAMQEQLAKLKKLIESTTPPDFSNYRNLSEEERAKLRQTMAKQREDRQKVFSAIQQELAKLGGPRPPMLGAQITSRDLSALRELAVKEKATETAKRIEALIARQRGVGPGGMPGFGRGRVGEPGRPGGGRGPGGPGGSNR